MKGKLKQQEKELQEKIKAWEDFEASKNKYFNIPHPNEIPYGLYTKNRVTPLTVTESKQKLKYLKTLSIYYDNNDYIVDLASFMDNNDEDFVNKAQITPEIRKRFHRVIYDFENAIKAVENEKTK